MSITFGYITARQQPRFDWLFDSLRLQPGIKAITQIVIVDYYAQACDEWTADDVASRRAGVFSAASEFEPITQWVPPKPNVWGGPFRLTKKPWWHISECRNTIICLAKEKFISFTDDRCVLAPTWLQAVREAMDGNYAVSGSYSKHVGMVVENGVITNPGTVIGVDPRNPKGHLREPQQTYGDSWYGCTSALPLEWCLEMGGFDEVYCSGLGLEDVVFGNMLVQNNHVTKFDPKMRIIEDRSPEACVNMPLRTDKDRHLAPKDKSHRVLEMACGKKRTDNPFDIRAMRDAVLSGQQFPMPTGAAFDWFDNQPLSEMVVL